MKKEPLSVTHPELTKEWHPDKNGDLNPQDVIAGSHKKVWWKCKKGVDHEWEGALVNRSRLGAGCPFCSQRKVSITNSLSSLKPDLAKEWHPTKNGKLTPDDVTAASSKKVWWQCLKNAKHEWETSVGHRFRGTKCPLCANRKLSADNSLDETHPELAKEWHPSKNGDLEPKNVVAGSTKTIWWKCPNGEDHEWKASLVNRSRGRGCPYCVGKKTSKTNSLLMTHRKLAKEWHPTKNGKLTSNDVSANSGKKVWWKCSEGDDHVWEARISSRTAGNNCAVCSNRKVSNENNLLKTHPKIAAEWHPTKNGDLTPKNVVAGTQKKFWWKCPKAEDHEWEAVVASRTGPSKTGCPFCVGQKVSTSNSFFSLYPNLAKEWHPNKNGELDPNNFTANSGKKVWWKCSEGDDHVWEASIGSRSRGSGCPFCNKGWTQDNIRHFVRSLLNQDLLQSLTPAELFLLAQQAGLVAKSTNRSEFVKALISGRLDPEELEEFAQGGDGSQLTKLFDELSAEDLLENSSNATTDAEADPEVSIQDGDLESDDSLPDTTPGSILDALESELWSTADKEAVEFLISSGISKLWRIAYDPERLNEVKKETTTPRKAEYAEKVRSQFRDELEAAESLTVPSGYNFRIKNTLIQPNLMQRHVAALVRERRRVGNWSGTGAGKTLSAVLASRVIDASLSVILCPNAVVEKGWASTIRNAFPSSVIVAKSLSPDWPSAKGPRYLILNYETLQQPTSEPDLANFLKSHRIDMVVIDEIHYAKQRTDEASKRRRLTEALCSIAAEANPELAVLGMSATPVINTLREGVSMINLVTGVRHSDLQTTSTLSNCMKLHQRLVSIGLRWMPPYPKFGEHNPSVDVSHLVDDIRALPKGSSGLLRLEQMLIEAKLDCILEHVEDGTLIYTEYVEGIVRPLTDALTAAGWKVGHYTGQDKSGFEPFCKGDLNVLIGSSAVGTGVDGLQHRASKLIIACAPWTAAAYEQLVGRLVRQGMQKKQVNVVFPITTADVAGEEWSWCQSRLNRIRYKKTIADAAVDGIIPLGHLRSPAQAYKDALTWLERLDSGHVTEIMRPRIVVPLSDAPVEVEKRVVQYGDFSMMNNRWNSTASSKLHARLHDDPTEWANYHTLYRESRKDWVVVPFERIGEWIMQLPKNRIVADFGCGEDILGQRLRKKGYTVHSFDHVSISDDVIACDIGDGVPLSENDIDVAIFSLSLMGANCGDYLREAARTLVFDGRLIICEPTKRLPNDDAIRERLGQLGFHVTDIMQEDRFTFIKAVRTDNEPDLKVTLSS